MTIAVTGANGNLGKLVISKLKEEVSASDIVALARTPSKASDLGVTVRPFDYSKPEGLNDSLEGVEKLLLISSSEVGQRTPQHLNVLKAAKEAGVKLLVYTSLLHADTSELSLAPEHRETEAAIKESGIPYIILRNGWYTENYTLSIAPAIEHGAYIGAAKEGNISSATRKDLADAAVKALISDVPTGSILELANDSFYTLKDFAAELSKQTGKEIPYVDLGEEKYGEALEQAGLPGWLAKAIAGWDVKIADGAVFDDSKTLSKLIGRPTTSYAKAIEDTLAQQ